MSPAPERRSLTSLVLAVVVHVALGGIVLGLATLGPPPAPAPGDDLTVTTLRAPRTIPGGGGGGGVHRPSPGRPFKKAPEPVPPPTVAPPLDEPATSPEPTPESPSDPTLGSGEWSEGGGGDEGTGTSGPGRGPGEGDGDGPGDSPGGGTPVPVAAPPADEPMALRSDMVEPRLVRRVQPEYPVRCRHAGIDGTVVLRCIIDTAGRVKVHDVRRSIECLDAAAVEAVSQWRYEPAVWNGRPQAVYLTVRITFR